MLIIYTSHRVELLPLLVNAVKRHKFFVLEEPETEELKKLLSGEMSAGEYTLWMDTPFPKYTEKLAETLLKIKDEVEILAVEPYLQIIEGVHRAVEENTYDEYIKNRTVRKVLEAEKKATGALLEYQEAFMARDFDLVVEKTIKFARADAERFVLRDRMRAEKIASIEETNMAIEAGQIHFLMEIYLKDSLREVDVKSVNLVHKAAEEAGIRYVKNPGNELTEYFIREIAGLENSDVDCELLASQALVYITVVSKEEILPSEKERFPHLIDEVRAARLARSLGYRGCRKFVEKVWFGK